MGRFSLSFDNPQSNLAKQQLMYAYQQQITKTQNVSNGNGNGNRNGLTGSMIDRVYKARPGCGACGK